MNDRPVKFFERPLVFPLIKEADSGFPGHLGGIRLLEFSADGRLFLAADLEMGLMLFSDHKPVHQWNMQVHDRKGNAHKRIRDIAISDDSRYAFVTAGLHLRCFDLENLVESWEYRPPAFMGFLRTTPRAVEVVSENEIIVTYDNGQMSVWTHDGLHVERWRSNNVPTNLTKIGDGNLLAGSDGFGISVWDAQQRRHVGTYLDRTHFYSVAGIPSQNRLLARGSGFMMLFDVESQSMEASANVDPGLPYLSVHPSGDLFAAGQGDSVVIYNLWFDEQKRIEVEGDRVLTASFTPDGNHVALGMATGDIRFEEV